MGVTPCTNPRLDGVVIDRLKVEVDPDYTYNGIIVQCVAYFIGRPVEASESANLTIQGTQCRLNNIIIHDDCALTQLMQHFKWVRCIRL